MHEVHTSKKNKTIHSKEMTPTNILKTWGSFISNIAAKQMAYLLCIFCAYGRRFYHVSATQRCFQ